MLHEAVLIKWKPCVLDVVKPYILIDILFKTRLCTKLIPPISLVPLVGLLQYVSMSVAERESNHKDTKIETKSRYTGAASKGIQHRNRATKLQIVLLSQDC
jgi:hypothetical protein